MTPLFTCSSPGGSIQRHHRGLSPSLPFRCNLQFILKVIVDDDNVDDDNDNDNVDNKDDDDEDGKPPLSQAASTFISRAPPLLRYHCFGHSASVHLLIKIMMVMVMTILKSTSCHLMTMRLSSLLSSLSTSPSPSALASGVLGVPTVAGTHPE